MNTKKIDENQIRFRRNSRYSGQHGTLKGLGFEGTLKGLGFEGTLLDPPCKIAAINWWDYLDGTCENSIKITAIKDFTKTNAIYGAASLTIPMSEVPYVIKQLKMYYERHKVQKPVRKVSRKT